VEKSVIIKGKLNTNMFIEKHLRLLVAVVMITLSLLVACDLEKPTTPALIPTVPPSSVQEVKPSAPKKPQYSIPDPAPETKPKTIPRSINCDPNYSPCVPIDSDVDCEGGSGNGPSYVRGPVRVVGRDIYRLDNDHDGIGCE